HPPRWILFPYPTLFRSSRERERSTIRNGCVELLTACGERGGIRPRSQREIPAAVPAHPECPRRLDVPNRRAGGKFADTNPCDVRSEEHTSELQSPDHLV